MTKFHVPDMSCGHCKTAIEDAVMAVDPGAALTFDMEARVVEMSSNIDTDAVLSLLDGEGYPATVQA